MFSEENIERTREKLVEYVKDNADKFEWKNVYSEGEYSGYWSISSEQVFSQPIDNAVQVFGIDSAMDIIVETLEKFYNIHNDGESEEDYKVFISADSPFLSYRWLTSDDVKSDKQTMGYIARANAESENEYENNNEEVSDNEMVNHPPHYNQGKFETIDIIEDIVAGYDDPVEAYLVGTTLKYLARAPFKGAKKQDLEKAEFYLKRANDRQQ